MFTTKTKFFSEYFWSAFGWVSESTDMELTNMRVNYIYYLALYRKSASPAINFINKKECKILKFKLSALEY
jgi:hypothetical protein